MASSLPEVKYGAAHYKYLEQDKTTALKKSLACVIGATNILAESIRIIKQSRHTLTAKIYDNYIGKEKKFCCKRVLVLFYIFKPTN